MENINKYGEHILRCPKCDEQFGKVKMEYCRGKKRGMLCSGIEEEHLHKICGNCEFEWLTECADSVDKEELKKLRKIKYHYNTI